MPLAGEQLYHGNQSETTELSRPQNLVDVCLFKGFGSFDRAEMFVSTSELHQRDNSK